MNRVHYFFVISLSLFVSFDSNAQKNKPSETSSNKFELYTWEGIILGEELKVKLQGKKVAGIETLNYLMRNQDEIPEHWKHYFGVAFWGAQYTADVGRSVRYLRWKNGAWSADPKIDWNTVTGMYDHDEPVLLLKQ